MDAGEKEAIVDLEVTRESLPDVIMIVIDTHDRKERYRVINADTMSPSSISTKVEESIKTYGIDNVRVTKVVGMSMSVSLDL